MGQRRDVQTPLWMTWAESWPDVEIAARIPVRFRVTRSRRERDVQEKQGGGVVQREGGGEEGVSRRGDWG